MSDNRKEIYRDKYFYVELEFVQTMNLFLIHNYITAPFSHTIFKRVKIIWGAIRQTLNACGITHIYTPGMNAKYAKLLGFKDAGRTLYYANGNVERLLIWDS